MIDPKKIDNANIPNAVMTQVIPALNALAERVAVLEGAAAREPVKVKAKSSPEPALFADPAPEPAATPAAPAKKPAAKRRPARKK